MIYTSDSLEFLKSRNEFEFNINYSDPPYALGSEVIIRPDGKVDYKKASDFMNKWDMPTGEYWEQWFKEAYRTLKHGGYLLMYGMDRQLLLFKYYANLAGLEEQQSLYWYFISNFPKATDLSKQIDKNAGAEREVVGQDKCGKTAMMGKMQGNEVSGNIDITAPSTDLAKKYEGYKYSISPLKQTNETIMVFRKPYKTGSCMRDVLEMEDGNKDITCGALDIDGNRVATIDDVYRKPTVYKDKDAVAGLNASKVRGSVDDKYKLGRYPAQTFCNEKTAEVLDKQSGIKVSKVSKVSNKGSIWGSDNEEERIAGHNDTGGCSKILHKCDYEKEDYDIYNYQPKVSKSERNAGCDEFEEIRLKGLNASPQEGTGNPRLGQLVKNNHPTLKPIALNERILKLFKTPNDDKIVYPFAGSGSEVIGGIKAGFKNWIGCELSPDYVEIANARIEYWQNEFNKESQTDLLKGEK